MSADALARAIATIPSGGWAVGVSGGADSVALLSLLRPRAVAGELRLHVAHLDHQTRGDASAGDAAFVGELAERWGFACSVARRADVELHIPDLPTNPSARYRAARLSFFRAVAAMHDLQGVLLAHHADDQAETVLHRLLRGSGAAGLGGMRPTTVVRGVRVVRPLLGVSGLMLREHLRGIGQPWREDASNASDDYARNRLRRVLAARPALVGPLLAVADATAVLAEWVRSASPRLPPAFPSDELSSLPETLQDEAAKRWLLEQGVPSEEMSPTIVVQLLFMSRDAAAPARQHFPGRVLVTRRRGVIAAAEQT